MISVVTPSWRALFCAAFLRFSGSDEQLARPWLRELDEFWWIASSSHALAIIGLVRKNFSTLGRVNFWVPDFFCNSALRYLRSEEVEIIFYPITEDLEPDYCALEQLALERGSPQVFLLTHFFGKIANTFAAKEFCINHGAWFVEDATHVLLPEPANGKYSDFIFYSPHKHLPIPDGSLLILSGAGLNGFAKNAEFKSSLRKIIFNYEMMHQRRWQLNFSWLVKRVIQKLGFNFFVKNSYRESPATNKLCGCRMSFFSKKLLNGYLDQLNDIALMRKVNQSKWDLIINIFKQNRNIAHEISKQNLETHIPYLANFSCIDEHGAEKIYYEMQRLGFPVSTWPDLPPEVFEKPEFHRQAILTRYTSIFLPVHQNLADKFFVKIGKNVVFSILEEFQVAKLGNLDELNNSDLFCHIPLPQNWQYGLAKSSSSIWSPTYLSIKNQANQLYGYCLVMRLKIPFLGWIAHINQGPVFCNREFDHLSEDSVSLLAEKLVAIYAVSKYLSKKKYLVLQIAPFLNRSIHSILGMKILGFTEAKTPSLWSSGRLALVDAIDSIKSKVDSNWRARLKRAEKNEVRVLDRSLNDQTIELLLAEYKSLQQYKGFKGLSEGLINGLVRVGDSSGNWRLKILTAHIGGRENLFESIGLVSYVQYTDTAMYLIGVSGSDGRRCEANAALLWSAIEAAKADGCKYFDLGGMGDNTPATISKFKSELNPLPYQLVGEWRTCFIF